MYKNSSRCGEEARVRHVVITEIRPFRRSNVQGVLLCLAFTNLILGANSNSFFARSASNKLVRRSYWLDLADPTLVSVMTQGIGAHLTNDEKRTHLIELKRDHLIDRVCVQEIIPPEKK